MEQIQIPFEGRLSLVRDNGTGVLQHEWMKCPETNHELAVGFPVSLVFVLRVIVEP
jgi:hypothetical protein